MFTFLVFILWIISIVVLAIEFSTAWLVVFIITLIYLVIRGVVLMGFDLDDLF